MKNSEETKYTKTHYGNTANTTYLNVNGSDWHITTMKRHNGLIICYAQAGTAGKESALFTSFSYSPFTDKSIDLVSEKATATEKAIKEIHLKGLAIFDQMKEAGTLPIGNEAKAKYEIKEGQILFLNGYGQDEHSHKRLAVYKIQSGSFGVQYHTVCLETLTLAIQDHVRNITEKFGIGIYYKEGDTIETEELNNYVIEAYAKEAAFQRNQQSEKILNAQLREAKIEEGKKLVNIPAGAKSVIIAILKKNESDPQTDYFAHSTEKLVYLAYSNHTKDVFSELRKAALNFPETEHLGPNKGIFRPAVIANEDFQSNGRNYFKGSVSDWHRQFNEEKEFTTKEEAEKYIQEKGEPHTINVENKTVSFAWTIREEEIEHREKYSGGSGYYLGAGWHSGWEVRKASLDLTKEEALNKLYIAASEERYFCEVVKSTPAETIAQTTAEPVTEPAKNGTIWIVDYSLKAIAVTGDTKPLSSILGNAGLRGKFNKFLKDDKGKNFIGWIFPKSREAEIRKALNL